MSTSAASPPSVPIGAVPPAAPQYSAPGFTLNEIPLHLVKAERALYELRGDLAPLLDSVTVRRPATLDLESTFAGLIQLGDTLEHCFHVLRTIRAAVAAEVALQARELRCDHCGEIDPTARYGQQHHRGNEACGTFLPNLRPLQALREGGVL